MRGRYRHDNDFDLDDQTAGEAEVLLDYTATSDTPVVDPIVSLDWCRLPIDDLLARLRDAHRSAVEWDSIETVDESLLDYMVAENNNERERLLGDIAGYRNEVARRLRRARRF